MNRIAALLVALATAFSFSQESLSAPAGKPVAYDTVHRVISDSVTIKALENSQEFYNSNFDKIQNSFNIFLIMISMIIAIFVGSSTYNNYKEKKKLEENFNNTKKKISNLEEKLEEQVKNQNDEFGKMKTELEKDKGDLEKIRTEIFGEIGYFYFSSAITAFNAKNYKEHFIKLAEHYFIFTNYNAKPRDIDLKRLTYFDRFIEMYDENNIELARIFLFDINNFMKYCEKNKIESMYVRETKEIWKKLCAKFGGEDKILKAIENYSYDDLKDR